MYSLKQEKTYFDCDKKQEVTEVLCSSKGKSLTTLKEYQNGIKIHLFRDLLGKDHPEFKTNKQQDALEYLNHLMDAIKKNQKQNNLPDLTEVFKSQFTSKLRCLNCNSFKLSQNQVIF